MEDASITPGSGQAPEHRRRRKRRHPKETKNWKGSLWVHIGIIIVALGIGAFVLVAVLRLLDRTSFPPPPEPAQTDANP
jgi:hypothetical protein